MADFRIHVRDETLQDLRERLARTKYVTPTAENWAAGVDPAYLRSLVDYWANGFDWRAREQWLNSFDHATFVVEGRALHYVRIAGEGDDLIPIVMVHGWPSAFTEYLAVGQRLADKGFEVIIPSLPGFLFSDPLAPFSVSKVAADVQALMGSLGHDRFGAFAGDIGGGVVARLGKEHADHIIGVQMIDPPWPASLDDLTPEEEAFFARHEPMEEADNGYGAIQSTRPDTIAAALVDSPAGLLAWILDKVHSWSDHGGDLESRFDRDYLLTLATLYWVTDSIGTSFRDYYDDAHPVAAPAPAEAATPPRRTIDVPLGVILSREPNMVGIPRSIGERAATDIRVWDDFGTGGHFMAHEEPVLTADAVERFFRALW
jgi:pimeloyl-ACP methyl ester carboxylesterase